MAEEIAYFGAGCFWHSELIFSKVNGILDTEVGYCLPEVENGSVSSVEVVKVKFDNELVDYEDLVETFWETHNPKNPSNQVQSNIERSVLFYNNENQRYKALNAVNTKREQIEPIYTSIHAIANYKKAPDKDQKYYFNK